MVSFAIFFALGHNHALLYDAGPDFLGDADSGNRILLPSLRAQGIAQLDTLVLSHDDIDHTGGTRSILQAMPVGWVTSSLTGGHPLPCGARRNRCTVWMGKHGTGTACNSRFCIPLVAAMRTRCSATTTVVA